MTPIILPFFSLFSLFFFFPPGAIFLFLLLFSCFFFIAFRVGLTPRLLLFTSELHPLASAYTALVAFSFSFGICFAGVVAMTDGVTCSVVTCKDRLYAQAWTLWSQSLGVLFGAPIAGKR